MASAGPILHHVRRQHLYTLGAGGAVGLLAGALASLSGGGKREALTALISSLAGACLAQGALLLAATESGSGSDLEGVRRFEEWGCRFALTPCPALIGAALLSSLYAITLK